MQVFFLWKLGHGFTRIITDLKNLIEQKRSMSVVKIMDAVKEIIMKDLEIFLDESILPEIDKKLNPPEEEAAKTEEKAEESEGAEEEDQEKE